MMKKTIMMDANYNASLAWLAVVIVVANTSTSSHAFVPTRPIALVGRRMCALGSAVGNDNDKDGVVMTVSSMAQTHMQGPLQVNGSGKPLNKQELERVKEQLEAIKQEFGFQEPARSFMDDDDIQWRFGGKPDYSLTNLKFLQERSRIHPPGSLELIVENLVKTWEMERSHKVDANQHQSVDAKHFRISANGGKVFDNQEANTVGNYNVLLNACPANLWDSENMTWEKSHDAFHDAFAAFPWEVLEVFSGPPKVAFTWRHWGHFTGTYEDGKYQGNGELIEMYGFGTAVVNDQLQLQNVEIYYNAQDFIERLRGQKHADEVNANWKSAGCPFAAMQKDNKDAQIQFQEPVEMTE